MNENKNNERELRKLIEPLRQRNKNLRQTNQRFVTSLLNETESNLRNTLITLAVFLFTFTSPLFTEFENLKLHEKELLITSWLLLFISVLVGVIHFILDIKFFEDSSRREMLLENLWTEAFISVECFEEKSKLSSQIVAAAPIRTSKLPIASQITTLLVGFLLAIIVASSILLHV